MSGRHRSPAARPGAAHQAARLVEMVDARTDEAHWLTQDALDAGRRGRGRYVALCGADVLAHSLAAPPLRACPACISIPDQRAKGRR